MKISQISSQVSKLSNKKEEEVSTGSSFGNVLSQQLDRLEKTQAQADLLAQDFAAGKPVDLHEVMIAAEEARITLEMTLQLRNKAIDAYKEVTNMQL